MNKKKGHSQNLDFFLMLKKGGVYFLKHKWLFLIFGLAVSAGWFFAAEKIFDNKKYSCSVLVKMEAGSGSRAGRREIRSARAALTGILKSRNFLQGVVDSLKLQFLSYGDDSREELLAYLDYDDRNQYGRYDISIENELLNVFYSNKYKGIENKLILSKSGESRSDTLEFNGIKIQLRPGKLSDGQKYTFLFMPPSSVAARIQDNLSATLQDYDEFLKISYSDTDRYLAKFIANTIARLFMKKSIELKTFKIQQSIRNLESQLSVAETNLKEIENRLKNFRNQNPYVTIATNVINNINQATDLTSQKDIKLNLLGRLKNLLTDYQSKTSISEKASVAQELVSLLNSADNNYSQVLGEQLNDQLSQFFELLNDYPEEHPSVVNVRGQINKTLKTIAKTTTDQIKSLSNEVAALEQRIEANKKFIQKLPSKEMQMARLIRERNIIERIYTRVKEQFDEAKIALDVESPDIFIVDEAILPGIKNNSQLQGIKLGGAFLLLLLTPAVLALLMALIDNKIIYETEVKALPFNIIASIPINGAIDEIPKDISQVRKDVLDPKLTTINYSPTPFNEAFRDARSAIFQKMDYFKERKALLITSSEAHEGKSLISANLAISFAQNKLPTLLIDMDLRRGLLHNMLASNKVPGISDVLATNVVPNQQILKKVIQQTQIPNLFFIPCGDAMPNPAELLASSRLGKIIDVLRKSFSCVIIDTAPLGIVSDVRAIMRYVDNSVMVVRSEKISARKIERAMENFGDEQIHKFLGIIFNGKKTKPKGYGYSYYRY